MVSVTQMLSVTYTVLSLKWEERIVFGSVSTKRSRLMSKVHFKFIFWPDTQIRQLLCPVKDDMRLRVPGIDRVPCICGGNAYVGKTGKSVTEILAEHSRYIWLHQLEKSGLAEHCILLGLQPQWEQVERSYQKWIVLGTVWFGIKFDPSKTWTVNRDAGYTLRTCWKSLLSLL